MHPQKEQLHFLRLWRLSFYVKCICKDTKRADPGQICRQGRPFNTSRTMNEDFEKHHTKSNEPSELRFLRLGERARSQMMTVTPSDQIASTAKIRFWFSERHLLTDKFN